MWNNIGPKGKAITLKNLRIEVDTYLNSFRATNKPLKYCEKKLINIGMILSRNVRPIKF